MSGPSEGWLWGPGVRYVWHQLFGDEGEAKLLSIVWQRCSGAHAVPRALWEGSRFVSQQAKKLHTMAQQLPLSWDAPRVSYTG